jgi:uncharacterized protein (DUF1778 family)
MHDARVEHREVRLDLRIDPDRKERLKRAAAVRHQSLTEFVLGSAEREAEVVLREQQTMTLSPRANEAFIEALMNPPEPSDTLRAAWRRYRAFVNE